MPYVGAMRPSSLPRSPGSRLSHTLSRLRTPLRPTLLPRATPLPPVAPPQRDWPSELLAAVVLEPDSVARGSFGEVFKGVDRATGAAVAVKVVSTKRPAGTKVRERGEEEECVLRVTETTLHPLPGPRNAPCRSVFLEKG